MTCLNGTALNLDNMIMNLKRKLEEYLNQLKYTRVYVLIPYYLIGIVILPLGFTYDLKCIILCVLLGVLSIQKSK